MVQITPHKRVQFVHSLTRILLGGAFIIFWIALSLLRTPVPSANAATASTINFQARLMGSAGQLVNDGNYHVEFKLYKSLSAGASAQGVCVGGGTDDCLWMETRTTGNLVTVKNGYLTVNLGSVTSFPSTINWDQDLWITMNIGGTGGSAVWDGEMTPRLKLTAVPYAFRAGQLAKLTSGNTSTLDFATQTGARAILLPDAGGTLAIATGGSFTSNGVLYGNGTSSIQATAAGTNGQCLVGTTSAAPSWTACSGLVTLQNAYAATSGNTILTTDARDIALTLADTTTDSNFTVTTATGSTGGTQLLRADGAGAADPAQLLLVKNNDVDRALPIGIKVDAANTNGKVTTAFDASSANITNALAIGGNAITGTNFSVTAAGLATSVGHNYGSGLLQGTGGATITGAISVTNNSTSTIGLNTGTSSGQITLGGGSVPLQIDSTNFDVSTAGALSGITTIATSSTINSQTISSAANFTGTVTIQGASSLTLGVTGTATGAVLFKGSTAASGTITLQSPANPGTYSLTLPTALGSSGDCLKDTTGAGVLGFGSCSGATTTLQTAYAATSGNTILTTDARDIAFTLADTTTDSNFTVTTATGSTSGSQFLRADGAGAADPTQLLLVKNNDVDRALPIGIKVDAANTNGKVTTAIDVSSANITNALAIGGNAITGTNFSVTAAGLVTSVGHNYGSGLLQGTGGATITGAISVTNNGSSTIDLNTGTSSGQITLGGGSAPLSINSTNFDVSTAGALSGITTLGLSGNLLQSGSTTITSGTGGYLINGGTNTAGHYLRNNGTSYVDGTIASGDLPSLTGTYVRNVPTATSDNVIAPTTASVVALTVKGTNSTAANVLEVFDSTASPVRQAFFNSAGSLNVAQVIQPTSSNAVDIGLSGTTFRSGFFGTSLVAGAATLNGTSLSTTGALTITGGTTLALTSTGANTASLDTGGASTLSLGNANATIINVAGNNTAHTIHIGDGGSSTAQTITVGSTGSATSQLTLNGGSTNGVVLNGGTTASETLTGSGDTIKTTTNSTTAFQVQNATGAPIFVVDTTNSNLITNPGFEVNTTGWSTTGAGTGLAIAQNLTKSNTYLGVASLQVTTASNSANTGASVTGFTASITPAQYTLTFYAKGGATNGNFSTLNVTITGGSAPACITGASVSTIGFIRYSCTFTSTTTNVTAINFVSSDAATQHIFYLDSVQLLATGSVTPYNIGNIQLRGVISNPATFQSSSDSTTAFQIQNAAGTSNLLVADTANGRVTLGAANSLVLGISSSTQGGILFNNQAGTNTITLQAPTTNPTSSYTLQLPTVAPAVSQCLQTDSSVATQLKFASCSSGSFLAKNATDTSAAAITTGNFLYTFTNSSSAVTSSVLKLDNGTNTNSTLSVTASGNPASGQALIFASNTNASPTGNLIDLQSGSSPTSKFSVTAGGVATAATSVLSPLFDTPSGTTTLNVGTNNATVGINLNQATVVAANKNFSLASGTGTSTQTYTGTVDATTITANSITATNSGINLSVTGLTTGNGLKVIGGTALTTGSLVNLGATTYNPGTTGGTGSVIGIGAITNGGTNTSGNDVVNGVSVASTLNTSGATGTKELDVFNAAAPTLTACSGGNCTWSGYKVTTQATGAAATITQNGLNIQASGVALGALNGINISGITAGAGTETAINVGSGWDNIISASNLTVTGAGAITAASTLQATTGTFTATSNQLLLSSGSALATITTNSNTSAQVYTLPTNGGGTICTSAGNCAGISGGTLTKRKATTETLASSTVLQDDNELFFAVAANETWHFTFNLNADPGSGSKDFKFAITAPSGATCVYGYDSQGGATNSATGTSTCGTALQTTVSITGARLWIISGTVANGSTAGNVTLQWAQALSSVTASSVFVGSDLRANRSSATGSSTVTLQEAYSNGNAITTTDGRNISISLADTTTDQTLEVTQAGTAAAFRVNDDGTFTDSTPFIIDASGNVGIGDSTPASLLTVGNGDLFGVDSSGNVLFSDTAHTISLAAETTANTIGNNLSITAGAANGSTTGAAGGVLALAGGAAAGSGNNAGGNITLDGGVASGSGTRGAIVLQGSGGNVGIGDASPAALLTVGNGDLFKVDTSGYLQGNNTSTATTGTTEATARTNVTTVTLTAAGSFANNDIIFINNAGQDYYTRIVSGGGTTTLTVSPAVSYDVSASVTKYNAQSLGATATDYTTLNNRFFQGYFLGGVVTGAGSTTLSDGNLNVSQSGASIAGRDLNITAGQSGSGAFNGGNLVLQAGATGGTGTTGSVIVKANGTDSTAAFQVQDSSANVIMNVDSANDRLGLNTNSPQAALDVNAFNTATQTSLAVRSLNSSGSLSASSGITFYTANTSFGGKYTPGGQTAQLDSSRIVSVYANSTGSGSTTLCGSSVSTTGADCVQAIVGAVGPNGVIYGTAVSVYLVVNTTQNTNYSNPNLFGAVALGNSTVGIYYVDSTGATKLIACPVTGTSIGTCGTAIAGLAGTNAPETLTPLTSTTFVEAYSGGARVVSVSGTTLTGNTTNSSTLGTSVVAGAELSSTAFVVAGDNGTATVGTISGTTITFGSHYTFDASGAPTMVTGGATALSSTAFVVGGSGIFTAGTVSSGTVITFGANYAIGGTSVAMSLTTLTSTSFAATYKSGSTILTTMSAVNGTIVTVGTTITTDTGCTNNCPNVSSATLNSGLMYVSTNDGINGTAMKGFGVSVSTILISSTNLTATATTTFFTSTNSTKHTPGGQTAVLDGGRVVSAYADSSNGTSTLCGVATQTECVGGIVGLVGPNGVSYGTGKVLYTNAAGQNTNYNNPNLFGAVALGNATVVFFYVNQAGTTQLVACPVTGTSIGTCGTAIAGLAGTNAPETLTPLTSTTFVEAYSGGARVVSVSGTTLTGNTTNSSTLGTSVVAGAELSSTAFVVAGDNGTATVGTISGTTITFGSHYTFDASGAPTMVTGGATALSSTAFVVGGSGIFTAGTVSSGTVITFGANYAIGGTSVAMSLTTLTSTSFAATYASANTTVTTLGTVNGTTVTVGATTTVVTGCSVGGCALTSSATLNSGLIYISSNTGISGVTFVGLAATTANYDGATLAVDNSSHVITNGQVGISLACTASNGIKSVTVTNGLITAAVCTTGGLTDYAEQYPSHEALDKGDIVMVDDTELPYVKKSTSAYEPTAIGIVSTDPAQVLGKDLYPNGYPIALSGRVPVKVNNSGGAIKAGDPITASAVPGEGMKATAGGRIVGYALEGFDSDTPGKITVFVNPSWYSPKVGGYIQQGDDINGNIGTFASLNVTGNVTALSLTVQGDATIKGVLTVKSVVVTANLTINGHVLSASTEGNGPIIVKAAAAGQDAEVTVDGTDTAGTITIKVKAGQSPIETLAAGDLTTLTFHTPFELTPRVVITATNDQAVGLPVYVTKTADGFKLVIKTAATDGAEYHFDYFVIGSQTATSSAPPSP